MKRKHHPQAASKPGTDLNELVRSIIEQGDARSFIEMYYWTREPGLLEIVRTIAMMSENARTALEVFVAMSHEPGAIAARWDDSGRLTLTSPQVGQAVAVMQYCAEHDDGEKPLLPN